MRRTNKNSYLIVDGYNIINAWDELKEISKADLEGAREKLIHYIIEYALNDEQSQKQKDKIYGELLEKFDFKGVVDLKMQNSKVKTSRARTFGDFVKFCYILSNVLIMICIIVLLLLMYN